METFGNAFGMGIIRRIDIRDRFLRDFHKFYQKEQINDKFYNSIYLVNA